MGKKKEEGDGVRERMEMKMGEREGEGARGRIHEKNLKIK
jgi:hypothetical protein